MAGPLRCESDCHFGSGPRPQHLTREGFSPVRHIGQVFTFGVLTLVERV
jgi:hypothetical protein